MNVDRMIFRVAGVFILASLYLGRYHHEYWYFFTAFVGLNMLQASFTGFCPMAKILKKLGLVPGKAFD